MATCQITFLQHIVPFLIWYNFRWKTDKLGMDEIDTF